MAKEPEFKAGPKKASDVWVEDLRIDLVMPKRSKPITRGACDRLINKWMKGRNKDTRGQNAKAYIPVEVAEAVKEYFKRRHNL
jgi:hypothetical protein